MAKEYMKPSTLYNRGVKINEILSNMRDQKELSRALSMAEMKEVMHEAEMIGLTLREALVDNPFYKIDLEEQNLKGRLRVIMNNRPTMSVFEPDCIRIFTPVTAFRDLNQSWYLSDSVKATFYEYLEVYGEPPAMTQPIVIMVKRHAHYISHGLRDNDNIEASRVINEIVRFLGQTDSPQRMVYVSTVNVVPKDCPIGTEYVAFPIEKLQDHLSEFWSASLTEAIEP